MISLLSIASFLSNNLVIGRFCSLQSYLKSGSVRESIRVTVVRASLKCPVAQRKTLLAWAFQISENVMMALGIEPARASANKMCQCMEHCSNRRLETVSAPLSFNFRCQNTAHKVCVLWFSTWGQCYCLYPSTKVIHGRQFHSNSQ